ncbi:hypothetical protein DSO57_1026229 [Entomophthora muscae]|uniref:Uncharacterized protein n=1 Tax=Entomophthora muscae TaxID=34485 RepID=A0ACC2SRC4_9FUNG|nr:hypothetical protein DSO57_1026229 [Entomophthora muscae]
MESETRPINKGIRRDEIIATQLNKFLVVNDPLICQQAWELSLLGDSIKESESIFPRVD